jgi:hypothetical protein
MRLKVSHMNSKEILEKGVTFQDLIMLVRELQDKSDNKIAVEVLFNRTGESTRKIVNIVLENNYRLVTGKVHP